MNLINSARANHGVRTLAVRSDLTDIARRHSADMARRHAIYHSSNLGSGISGWREIGENVGSGTSVSSIHNAFMNSSEHRANILHAAFNQLGVGVVRSDGRLYVTELFVKRGTTVTVTRTYSSRPRVHRAAVAPHRPARVHHVAAKPQTRVVEMLWTLVALDAPVPPKPQPALRA